MQVCLRIPEPLHRGAMARKDSSNGPGVRCLGVSDDNPGGMVAAASEALAKAGRALATAAAAAGIGLAALVTGLLAAGVATVAIISRVVGEMLSLLAEMISGMIEVVVSMVPTLLQVIIVAGAITAMWLAFGWAWTGYSQDMPSWVAAILAATVAIIPVAYAIYRGLWPMVIVASLGIVAGTWLLLYAGPIVRTGVIVASLGAVVFRELIGGDNG